MNGKEGEKKEWRRDRDCKRGSEEGKKGKAYSEEWKVKR